MIQGVSFENAEHEVKYSIPNSCVLNDSTQTSLPTYPNLWLAVGCLWDTLFLNS